MGRFTVARPRPPLGFTRTPEMLYGPDSGKANALHTLFDIMVAEDRIDYHPMSSVVAIAEGALHVLTPGGRRIFGYDRLILATGATDRLAPVPGWQSAGVYSLGAAQIALKAQGVALGRNIVLAGSGPLLTLVAYQLLKMGAQIAAVLDTAPLSAQVAALPDMLTRPGLVLRGVAMRLQLGRRYHAGVTLEGIECDEYGPAAVRWSDARGTSRVTPCDMVGLGWHLRAETQLAGLAGCAFDYDEGWAQWLPRTDRLGRAVEGVYLAGDGVRILGADGAELSGRLAAAACLADLGLSAPDVASNLRRQARYERFARALARAFPWPAALVRAAPDGTIVCRCEGITAGEVREAAVHGGAEANRVKSLSRLGMGRCQGRYCQLAGNELIAARTGTAVCDAERLREQAPVRPVPIAAWMRES
ncbi:FAD/NAD(P)-binding oxidoreductase [Phyllobacterium salinisoli]|uniref:FAD/NAD(P)-dependent oxidoreductase n=1 Tax=Phyllobacterium salinisoli TaxID=1899321 RepID=UPI00315CD640